MAPRRARGRASPGATPVLRELYAPELVEMHLAGAVGDAPQPGLRVGVREPVVNSAALGPLDLLSAAAAGSIIAPVIAVERWSRRRSGELAPKPA